MIRDCYGYNEGEPMPGPDCDASVVTLKQAARMVIASRAAPRVEIPA